MRHHLVAGELKLQASDVSGETFILNITRLINRHHIFFLRILNNLVNTKKWYANFSDSRRI